MKLLKSCALPIVTFFLMLEVHGATLEVVGRDKSSKYLWGGHYSRDSDLCTDPGSGASCSEKFRDVLDIQPNGQRYLVSLNSTQAAQHVCSFTFQMNYVSEALVYKTEFGDVVIRKNDSSLKIYSSGIDPTALGLAVCGAHADIDGLEFSLDSRMD
ncbi:hypothetical protein HX875_10355 [Pseudomonas yamanorum]|uniref:hypothetical protein n=1 Tax=Pseudomonas yamanorum TaxID=515393 RepID=UPI0015A13F94|nr:hypothetical protein [Pseudomonas yamanorum]NWE39869.1 hypothetical protein [Pseudomonas yamanorum]